MITLFLCGDVMTGRGIDQILPHPGDPRLYEAYVKDARDYVEMAEQANGAIRKPVDFAYIWGAALAELERVRPDARIINLETAVTTAETAWPKGIHYRMHPANVGCLTAAGIDCCVLANNHILDWDRAGLEETLTTLAGAGLRHSGAGHNRKEAAEPAIIELRGGGRVLVFGFGSPSSGVGADWGATAHRAGVNLLADLSPASARRIADEVGSVKRTGDIVVASIHWGSNWGYEIPREQRAFARLLIDTAGVDVIHGHSSHHVKGIEVYRDHLILYGCGDFITDYEGIRGYEAFRDDLGLMYFPTIDVPGGRLVRVEMTPTRLRNLRVNRASREETTWLAEVLMREGRVLGTTVTHADDRLALRWDERHAG